MSKNGTESVTSFPQPEPIDPRISYQKNFIETRIDIQIALKDGLILCLGEMVLMGMSVAKYKCYVGLFNDLTISIETHKILPEEKYLILNDLYKELKQKIDPPKDNFSSYTTRSK